ncbi:MAG TPA: hydroxymethylbilane synthase [Candidatus Binataceae bacterium]|nr:hydroxymethylbilane synthase [Candidatus Binataceae bacterium]
MEFTLRIGSRPSQLAIAQASAVQRELEARIPGLKSEIVPIRTSGDRLTAPSLADLGGKGLFIKELEEALRAGRIDIAVHSMKDLPAALAPEFRLAAVPRRENPRDALISHGGGGMTSLARGARVGTASPRRKFEALRVRPDLTVMPLRGNVDTRMRKLDDGQLDAVILAMAGLNRIGKSRMPNLVELDERDFVPAAGQGALAIEALSGNLIADSTEVESALTAMTDRAALAETSAERAFLATIGASCVSPVGVKASLQENTLGLSAILFSIDGARTLSETIAEPLESDGSAALAGVELGRLMLARGAAELLGDG